MLSPASGSRRGMRMTLATRMPKRSRLGEACYPVAGQWIAHGASVDLSARGASSITHKGLTAIVGGGRGCQLRTDASVCAIWIPLRGRVQIGSDGDSLLHVSEARVTEADADVHGWVSRFNLIATTRGCERAGCPASRR